MQSQPQRPNTHIKFQSKSIHQSSSQQNQPIQNIEQHPMNQNNKQGIKSHRVSNHQGANLLDPNPKYPQKNNKINSHKITNLITDNKISSQPIDTEIKINKSQTKHPNVNNNKYKSIKTTYNTGNNHAKRMQRLQTENPQGYGNYAQIYGYNTNTNKNKSHKLTMQRNSNHISTSFSRNKMQANTNSNYIFTTAKNSQDQLQILHTSTLSNPKCYNKHHPPLSTKQQLYQQNIHLKNVINQLKQTVTRQKIQTEMQKKKNKKYTTILNREFKKQFYYATNNNSKSVNYGPCVDYIDKAEVYEQRNNEAINRITNLYNPKNSDKNSKQDSQNSQQKLHTHTQNSPNPTSLYQKNYKHYKMLTKYPNMDSAHNLSNSYELGVINHSNQYMVAGIKQKYQELRGQHQKILAELTAVKGTDQMKKLEEIGIYCRALQESNKRLGIGLQIAQNKLASYEQKGTIKDQTAFNSTLVGQKSQKIESLQNKNSVIKQQNKKLKQQQKQHLKLIDYLQKLIISKDTLYVKSISTTKKLNKILQKMQVELENQRKQNNSLKSQYIKQLEQIHERYQKKNEEDKKIFQQTVEERNTQIKRLQKQVSYLSTILDHWKPSGKDKINLEQQANRINKQRKRKQSTVSNNFSVVSKDGKNQYERHDRNVEGVNLAHKKEDYEKVSQKVSMTNRISRADESDMLKSSKKMQKALPSNTRKRKTAAVKNSQNSKKTRGVTIENLSQLPQFLRYRLIGLNIQTEEAIKHLDYTPKKQEQEDAIKHSTYSMMSNGEISENQKWKKKYITLFELKSILIQEPFKLKAQDALMLSRYIIEDECFFQNGDTNNGFVYFDLENQTQRTVAKSILKAFIQTHAVNIPAKTQKQANKSENCEKQWMQIIDKNGSRLNTALMSIAPSGMISKQRWNELLNSINVQANEQVKEWCIGRMLIQSDSLIKLKYRAIVPETD